MIRRKLLWSAGLLAALAAGLGADLGGMRARAADALGLAPAPDFKLQGQLTQGGYAFGQAPAGAQAVTFNGKPVALAADGRFLIAFDRDSGPVGGLSIRLANGQTLGAPVAISKRAWQLEYIPIGPRPGTPPNEEYARRRAGELARINAARSVDHAVDGWRQKFIWPVYGRISGRFGSQRIYNGTPGSYHSGMDIATGASGTPFVAPADGVVILAAQDLFSLEGHLLMIDHGMGLNSAFLHCSKLAVKEGDVVRQGQYLGNIGMTGRATGPHLHWSMKWRDSRLDPSLFAGSMPGR